MKRFVVEGRAAELDTAPRSLHTQSVLRAHLLLDSRWVTCYRVFHYVSMCSAFKLND